MDLTETFVTDRWGFDAGHRALDFANTHDWHAGPNPKERLKAYGDFTDWARQGGLITAAQQRALDAEARAHPASAKKALAAAHRLRDAAQRLYDAQALDEEPEGADRKYLHAKYAEALAGASLDDEDGGLEFSWPQITKDLEYPLRPLAWAAMQLLLSEDRERIGRCQDDRGCGFLFIDTSKNHSRRWCSMDGCGNRAKAKRFYEKRG